MLVTTGPFIPQSLFHESDPRGERTGYVGNMKTSRGPEFANQVLLSVSMPFWCGWLHLEHCGLLKKEV